MVNNKEKISIMSRFKGLIFPIKWDEPFGLAIIESLYSGCPVFGSEYGSLPELIAEEVGITSNNIDILISAIKSNNFKSKVCYEYAIENLGINKWH